MTTRKPGTPPDDGRQQHAYTNGIDTLAYRRLTTAEAEAENRNAGPGYRWEPVKK